MSTIGNFFKRIGASIVSVWSGFIRFLRSIRGGLQDFVRAPGATTAKWFRSLVNGFFRLLRWLVFLIPNLIRDVWNWFKNITIAALLRALFRTVVVLAVVIAIAAFFLIHFPNSQIPEYEPADLTVYLGQGWGPSRESDDRQIYYYTPQGTGWSLRNMRYSWFVNLELPWGKRRFTDPNRMRAYGFLVDAAPTEANPHQLPVGFAKHYDPNLNAEVMDITCAACHTGGLLARQKDGTLTGIRIDGGQAMHAFTAMAPGHFGPVLLGSMASTYINPVKFNRFARNVLGEEHYKDGKKALRAEFKKTMFELLKTGGIEKRLKLAPTDEGFGRTDAIARIANMVFGAHLDDANYHVGDAPVSYPPTWDIWKFDWVQYSGSVAQPMARNLGESLGVGATYALKDSFEKPISAKHRYATTTRIEDLHKIELTLRKLRPPQWPEDLLGKIDKDKAVQGGLLFVRTCQGCHGPRPAGRRQKTIEAPGKTDAHPHWRMKLLSIYDIGTDPTAAVNFVRNPYDLTKMGLSNEDIHDLLRSEMDHEMDRILAYDFPAMHERCSGADQPESDVACNGWSAARKKLDDKIETSIDSIDLTKISVGQGLNYIGLYMRKKLYEEAGYTWNEQQELNGFGALDLPQVKLVYKARPLSGMWATPPFLHNGSVRNIYQLLSPANERDKRFFVGRREYDSVQLGYVGDPLSKGGFWYDTTKTGNANTGHEFRAGYKQWQEGDPPQFGVIGPEYTSEERYQIMEYLKVHHDDGPYSKIYAEVLDGMLSKIGADMPEDAANIGQAQAWPDDQSCNLYEYLGNHLNGDGNAAIQANIDAIRAQLLSYFSQQEAGYGFRCHGGEVW